MSDTDKEEEDFMKILEDMSIQETEIVGKPEYVATYYVPVDQVFNRGWLTLVHPKYAGLAHDIMVCIVESMDWNNAQAEKNELICNAQQKVNQQVDSLYLSVFVELDKHIRITQ
ncbi:hypothetical protein ACA910_011693 [Epithemia clementina (nom. ined.)]